MCIIQHPRHNVIELQRLNGESFILNAFLVEQIQSLPDTTITLTNGRKIVVQTDEKEVVHKMTNYFQQIGLFGTEQK